MKLKSQMFTKRPADVADVVESIARIFMRDYYGAETLFNGRG